LGSWSWRTREGAKGRESACPCPPLSLLPWVFPCPGLSTFRVRGFNCLFPSFPLGRSPINITHFMSSSMLGSRGILYLFIYLFDFWTLVEFGDPEVVNVTRKPSSIFSISHSIRIISFVFFPLSRFPYPVSVLLFTVCLSILYYVAHTLVSWQLSSPTIVACRVSPVYIIFTCSEVSAPARVQMIGESNSAGLARLCIVQRNVKYEAKRKIGDCSSHLDLPSTSFSSCQRPTL